MKDPHARKALETKISILMTYGGCGILKIRRFGVECTLAEFFPWFFAFHLICPDFFFLSFFGQGPVGCLELSEREYNSHSTGAPCNRKGKKNEEKS